MPPDGKARVVSTVGFDRVLGELIVDRGQGVEPR